MPTMKQKKAVERIVENHGNVSRAMLEVGYDETTAKNPKNLTDSKGYKEAAKPFLEKLRKERDAALQAMEIKREEASYADVRQAVDSFTKLEELLSGRPTERGERVYGGLSDEEISKMED